MHPCVLRGTEIETFVMESSNLLRWHRRDGRQRMGTSEDDKLEVQA